MGVVWSRLLRLRYVVLVTVAVIWWVVVYRPVYGDWLLFEYVDRVALHRPGFPGGWTTVLHVYSLMPKIQIGPPAFLAALPSQLLSPHAGGAVASLVMMLAAVVCIGLVERTARLVGQPAHRTRVGVLLGGLVVMPVWSSVAFAYMHLDDVIVITAMLASLPFLLHRRNWWAPALLLGTAMATKPWAVVAAPLLLRVARRDVARAALLAAATTVLWWAPFLIVDRASMSSLGGVSIPVARSSTWQLLGQHDFVAQWLRPLQFAAGVVLAALAVRRGRWLAAPLVGMMVRVTLDAQTWPYYAAGPVLAALVWDVTRGHRVPRWTLAVAAVEYVRLLDANATLDALVRVAMCLLVVGWFVLRSARDDDRGRVPEQTLVGGDSYARPSTPRIPTCAGTSWTV